MTKQVQRRRGTATQHTSFTGAEGEISVNTTNKSTHVHDGVTAGGIEAARADLDNVDAADVLAAAGITASSAELNHVDGVTSSIQTQIDAKAPKNNAAFTGGVDITGDLSFGDNDKARFGAGSDLQIYHDGDHSYITDTGTGRLNVRSNVFRVYNAAGTEISANFVQDGAVTLYHDNAAKLSTTSTGLDITGNATFADNGKAIFGAGSDLQIYHDGDDSYVSDQGTGDLILRGGSNVKIQNANGGQTMINALVNNAVSLSYNGSTKLATSSTGADVTGTLTSDGLTVVGVNLIRATNAAITDPLSVNNRLRFEDSDPTKINGQETGTIEWYTNDASNVGVQAYISVDSSNTGGGYMHFATGDGGSPLERIKIDNDGDISFYEDTGTTAKFFWDASAESLQVGSRTSDESSLFAYKNDATYPAITVRQDGAAPIQKWLGASGAERMRIDSSGNVGIGTSSPAVRLGGTVLTIDDTSTAGLELAHSGAQAGEIFSDATNTYVSERRAGSLVFRTAGSNERMRIDSSGNVWIGTGNSGAISPSLTLGNAGASGGVVTGTLSLGAYGAAFGSNIISSSNFSSNSASYLAFGTTPSGSVAGSQPTERMRIDSSGNLLVGKTSQDFGATGGFEFYGANGDSLTIISRDDNHPLELRRNTTDGDIVKFIKDGSTVGSIGTFNGDAYIGNGDTGITFADGSDVILPVNASTPTYRDAAVSLGNTLVRFKDLYLSGGVYLGGTGSANKLDDYEEGTWTPSIPGLTTVIANGSYTKAGDIVTAHFKVSTDSATDGAGAAISGLPFTGKDTTGSGRSAGYFTYNPSGRYFTLLFSNNTTQATFREDSTGSTVTRTVASGHLYWGTIIYKAF